MTGFSPKRSTRKPAGIDNTPYAIKNEKGRNTTAEETYFEAVDDVGNDRTENLVSNDVTNVRNTMGSMYRFLGMERELVGCSFIPSWLLLEALQNGRAHVLPEQLAA